MNELVNSLLVWAVTLTGYAEPLTLPTLEAMSKATLSSTLCEGKLCTAVAYYDAKTQTIYYDETLNLKQSNRSRSFILHELVHHLQYQSNQVDANSAACETRIKLEQEAYRVQRYFLLEHDADTLEIDLAINVLNGVC